MSGEASFNPAVFPWIEVGVPGNPSFQNGAVNFGPPFSTAAYFIDSQQFVNLKGTIILPTVTGVIFTLPSGYFNPGFVSVLGAIGDFAGTISQIRLHIEMNGDVNVVSVGGNTFIGLDGLGFRVFPQT